jgi:hypothetical protein
MVAGVAFPGSGRRDRQLALALERPSRTAGQVYRWDGVPGPKTQSEHRLFGSHDCSRTSLRRSIPRHRSQLHNADRICAMETETLDAWSLAGTTSMRR